LVVTPDESMSITHALMDNIDAENMIFDLEMERMSLMEEIVEVVGHLIIDMEQEEEQTTEV